VIIFHTEEEIKMTTLYVLSAAGFCADFFALFHSLDWHIEPLSYALGGQISGSVIQNLLTVNGVTFRHASHHKHMKWSLIFLYQGGITAILSSTVLYFMI